MTLWQTIKEATLFVIPRFIKDQVACYINEDGEYEMDCSAKYLTVDELQRDYDGIISIDVFAWFGHCWPMDFDGSIVVWNRKV